MKGHTVYINDKVQRHGGLECIEMLEFDRLPLTYDGSQATKTNEVRTQNMVMD
jgi:hypothetical protein